MEFARDVHGGTVEIPRGGLDLQRCECGFKAVA
ncbi:hypothetical protein SDC9_146827 [bioreactor metagenome]|uniref:Uncharacterized protein n=1 Tax=bioreactor metagenome TaxID=1076179 RepID=A0A645EDX9_9ZZZZ